MAKQSSLKANQIQTVTLEKKKGSDNTVRALRPADSRSSVPRHSRPAESLSGLGRARPRGRIIL